MLAGETSLRSVAPNSVVVADLVWRAEAHEWQVKVKVWAQTVVNDGDVSKRMKFEFEEPLTKFPSAHLIAQIMLVG